jgi:hypothetical protein
VAVLSRDATMQGMEFVDLPIPNGQSDSASATGGGTVYVQGLTTGTVSLTVEAVGFTSPPNGAITVVPPALAIAGLPTTIGATAADDSFQITVGVPNGTNTALAASQAVNPGGSVMATVVNGNGSVARLTTTAGADQTRTVAIPAGENSSPASVAAGGIAFDPLGSGTTTVSASIPGFAVTSAGSVTVTVSP